MVAIGREGLRQSNNTCTVRAALLEDQGGGHRLSRVGEKEHGRHGDRRQLEQWAGHNRALELTLAFALQSAMTSGLRWAWWHSSSM